MTKTHAIILAGGAGTASAGSGPSSSSASPGARSCCAACARSRGRGRPTRRRVPSRAGSPRPRRLLAAAGPSPSRPRSWPADGPATRARATASTSLDAADDDVIVVHDAVRPLVPLEVIRRAIEPVVAGLADSTDTVISSADTLVMVDGDDVVEIPTGRASAWPDAPGVPAEVLARPTPPRPRPVTCRATDDCSLVLRYVPGARVMAVAGDEVNLKITTRIDLVMADRMIQMRTLRGPTTWPAGPMVDARMLVVGGTTGIGRAIAEGAPAQGARVIVDGRSLGLDVRDPGRRGTPGRGGGAARRPRSRHLHGRHAARRPVVSTAPADLAEMIDVNLTGSLNVARGRLPVSGRPARVADRLRSSSFTRGRPDYVAYSASKAAVVTRPGPCRGVGRPGSASTP